MRQTRFMSDRTREVAHSAADAIRELVCRTAAGQDDLELPTEVHEILISLDAMAATLPKLLAQLASWLLMESRVGKLAHDGGDDARERIGDAIAGLSDAMAAAYELAARLGQAHNSTKGLTEVY